MTDYREKARGIMASHSKYRYLCNGLLIESIALALTQAYNEGLARGAEIVDKYDFGKADEHIPDDKESAYNLGCEDSKVDIATAIRKELTTQKEREK